MINDTFSESLGYKSLASVCVLLSIIPSDIILHGTTVHFCLIEVFLITQFTKYKPYMSNDV